MTTAAWEFPGRAERPRAAAAAACQEIAAVFDGTDAGRNACWRAAALAADLQVACRIVVEGGIAERTDAEHFARALTGRTGSFLAAPIRVAPARAGLLREARAPAGSRGLLVVPASDSAQAGKLACLAERLLRTSQVAVLLCRQPAERRYARTWVDVDLARGCERLVAAAVALAPQAHPRLVHVLDTRDEIVLRELGASSQALQAYRHQRVERARKQLEDLLPCAGAGHAPIERSVEFGAASEVWRRLARDLAGEDLIVLGTRRRGLFPGLLFKRTLRNVLEHARADTLLIPIP